MIIMTYISSLLLLVLGIVLWRKEKRLLINGRLQSVFQEQRSIIESDDDMSKLSFSKRVIIPTWKKMKRSFQKNIDSEKQEKLENKLLQAGNPFRMTAVEFRFVQLILFSLLPMIAGGYGYMLNMDISRVLLFVLIGFLIALFYPSYYLKQKTNARNKQAMRELPDFIDLVTVSIEAGLGFDSALSKVVEKRDGVLSDEFQRCLEEVRLGKTRREALTGIKQRLTAEDVQTLIGSIIQAEQLGIGMVQILRVQSDEIRQKRKQRAEEQAMKAPIKMLFPLVLFIFPCIFIVLLGPAIIQIFETF
ncbi:type II secretion system F family protein [Evansella sp. AB-rgal1]|uniref:type II secretion system F family protein n=1 Tax=Evansella sp. AB-rgal1 TaxID=3242696 RepID=UPI00359DF204